MRFFFIFLIFISSTALAMGPIQDAVNKANNLQLDFQEKAAIALLTEVTAQYKNNFPTQLSELKALGDAYLLLALLYKNSHSTHEMTMNLVEAVHFNPSLTADDRLVPPSIQEQLEKQKNDLWETGPFGSLAIESLPDNIDLFINGAYKGKTPLRLDHYPTGPVMIIGKLKNQEAHQQVVIQAGVNPKVQIKVKVKKE